MPFLSNLKTNLLEYRINQWRMQYFRLSGFNYLFSTNKETYEGVSGLVGSILSVREKERILAKGGIVVHLVKKLVFCGTNYVSRIPQKTLNMYALSIVMRLRTVHKGPHEPSLEKLYCSDPLLVCDFDVDLNTGHFAVATPDFIEVRKLDSGRGVFHEKTKLSSLSNRVAFCCGKTGEDSILAVCSGNEIGLYVVPIVSNTHKSIISGSRKLSYIQKMALSETVNTVQFSPDGSVLVICLSNNTVQVLKKKDSDDGTKEWVCVEILPEQTGEITSVAFYQQPEILILAIGLGDNTIKIWEISSDETKPSSCVDTLAGHTSWVTSVSFHPCFKVLASGSNDPNVKVWIPNVDGQFICMLTLEHGSPVSSVAFSPSGFLASGGNIMDMYKLWRLIMSATCVNAELVLIQFIEGGINQLKFCQNTDNLLILQYDGVTTLE
jgi:WD40 repeat protein